MMRAALVVLVVAAAAAAAAVMTVAAAAAAAGPMAHEDGVMCQQALLQLNLTHQDLSTTIAQPATLSPVQRVVLAACQQSQQQQLLLEVADFHLPQQQKQEEESSRPAAGSKNDSYANTGEHDHHQDAAADPLLYSNQRRRRDASTSTTAATTTTAENIAQTTLNNGLPSPLSTSTAMPLPQFPTGFPGLQPTPPPSPPTPAGFVDEVRCTLSSIVQTFRCHPPARIQPGAISFVIVFDDMFAEGFVASLGRGDLDVTQVTVLTEAIQPAFVTFEGVVRDADLDWVIAAGRWNSTIRVNIHGLRTPSFALTTLNPFEGLFHINLSNNSLTSISLTLLSTPRNRFHRRDIVSMLDLSHNALFAVPVNVISQLERLHTLALDHNQITRLGAGTFDRCDGLVNLGISNNFLSVVEAGALRNLHHLRELKVNGNLITQLNTRLLDPDLGYLSQLDVSNNPLRVVAANAFAHAPKLILLTISHATIDHLPATLFDPLTTVMNLDLSFNRISSPPPNVFSRLSQLITLNLEGNGLTEVHPALLRNTTRLRALILSSNKLTSLPPGVFATVPRLNAVHMSHNRLTSFDERVLGTLTQGFRFHMRDNRLTTFHITSTTVFDIDIGDNPFVRVPDISFIPGLSSLRMSNHHIRTLNISKVLVSNTMRTLEIGAAPHIADARLVVDEGALAVIRDSQLVNLDVSNMHVPTSFWPLLRNTDARLRLLFVGWPGLSETTLDLREVCDVLLPSASHLAITNTNYRFISVCNDHAINTLSLQQNRNLRLLHVPGPVTQLNVSGCTHLTNLTVPSARVLDISETSIPFSPKLCDTWGSTMLLARNLISTGLRDRNNITHLLRTCLARVDLLDLSGNAWLDKPSIVHDAANDATVIGKGQFLRENLRSNFPARSQVITLNTEGTPIGCIIALDNVRGARPPGHVQATELAYALDCSCRTQFRLDGDECVPDVLTTGQVAGIAIGTLLLGLGLAFGSLTLYRRFRAGKMLRRLLLTENELQKRLIEEKDEEVMALKKAWEIGHEELAFVRRIDAGSEGAFGEVWLASWDTVMVAVKVLRQSMMAFDEGTVVEFEKEVEFLQRTRHPHVVRFFGAGTDPNGSPFLVLEYVALGSLNSMLQKQDFDAVLSRYQSQQRASQGSDTGDGAVAIGGGAVAGGVGELKSGWELKVRLARDVCAGMAFIHSLGHIHRDLKSGNVLVSTSLRAKIADFGSIRQCLLNSSAAQATTPMSGEMEKTGGGSRGGGDIEYTTQAGTTTMHLTMTAGVGTPLYMAPEVLAGGQYDAKADVFSFGVLMWEVATQRTPDLIAQEKGSNFRGPLFTTLLTLLEAGKRLTFKGARDQL
ncbi:TKL protein kinase [Salpingoeca rosetta]|uniref:TKL protein kinase n=1 Tax=Salpingoeca rosetta (strain ATCC 50818 / BSB-021) TaxID=946362 RepID=F2UJN5_SALR5|nr:TKL protein kinase [Salpingoeca rosetta]EGD77334.1 TKL protein kinase [Salpingoeca rosetta]|eukprot:XP_004990678.1 TKL protein kinase [Salpingoeca rosetta]